MGRRLWRLFFHHKIRYTSIMKTPQPVKLGRAQAQKERHHHEPFQFPKDFLWGTATSSHQIEGGNDKNDWWEWEKKKGHIDNNERSGNAADSWNQWQEDLAAAKGMHLNVQRFSIEWSRVEPKEGEWDENAIAHYRKILQAHHDAGMKVMLTLYHFTLPQWVAKKGGWSSRRTAKYFKRFVAKMAVEYAPLVDFWITINEPIILLSQGYLYGTWPPGKKSVWKLMRAFFHLARAHRLAYRTIHRVCRKQIKKKPRVGIAKNVISYSPYRRHSFGDALFVKIIDWLWNHSFYSFTERTHDFIGINYYFHYRIAFASKDAEHLFFQVRKEDREASALGWEIYPTGIFSVLRDMMRYRKPIYVTENGIATSNDRKRVRFLIGYVKEMYHAIKSGADVRGYCYWSLIDNFEWDKGFDPRFGLIDIDYKTFKRTPRRSAFIYAQIARDNQLSHDLMRFIGHGM